MGAAGQGRRRWKRPEVPARLAFQALDRVRLVADQIIVGIDVSSERVVTDRGREPRRRGRQPERRPALPAVAEDSAANGSPQQGAGKREGEVSWLERLRSDGVR
jgi:hypothetical protein